MTGAPNCKLCRHRHWGLDHVLEPIVQHITAGTEKKWRRALGGASATEHNTVTLPLDTVTKIENTVTETVTPEETVTPSTGVRGKRIYGSNADRQRAYRKRKRE